MKEDIKLVDLEFEYNMIKKYSKDKKLIKEAKRKYTLQLKKCLSGGSNENNK